MKLTRRQFVLASAAVVMGTSRPNRAAGSADEPWTDARQSGPFILQADFPLGEHQALLEELLELERELQRVLGVPGAKEPIYVYLFASRARHERFHAARFPNIPYRTALFRKEASTSSVFVHRGREMDVDIRHECTHALLHAGLDVVPLWLDEGLAEYFEAPHEDRPWRAATLLELRLKLLQGRLKTVQELEQMRELDDMRLQDYQYAWAWTHFMLHGPKEAHQALVAYLRDIRQRVPSGPLSERLDRAVPNAVERMVVHFKHWPPRPAGGGA